MRQVKEWKGESGSHQSGLWDDGWEQRTEAYQRLATLPSYKSCKDNSVVFKERDEWSRRSQKWHSKQRLTRNWQFEMSKGFENGHSSSSLNPDKMHSLRRSLHMLSCGPSNANGHDGWPSNYEDECDEWRMPAKDKFIILIPVVNLCFRV